MGQPIYNHNNPVWGAATELVSAQSALNMLPDPRCAEELADFRPDVGDDGYFLSRADRWAEHAYDHISAAFDHLVAVQNVIADMQRIAELLDARTISGQVPIVDINRARDIAARYAAPIAFEERVK